MKPTLKLSRAASAFAKIFWGSSPYRCIAGAATGLPANALLRHIAGAGLLVLFLLAALPLTAQELRLARGAKAGGWALIDTTGKAITAFKYDYIGYFTDGVAVYELEGREGLMNYQGQPVLPPEYDLINFFYETPVSLEPEPGVARLMKDERWGVANSYTGELLLPLEYEYIDFYANGRVFFNRGGRWTFRSDYDSFEGGVWGLMDTNGSVLREPQFLQVKQFEAGYALVVDSASKRWGVLNRAGEWQLEPTWVMLEYTEQRIGDQRLWVGEADSLKGWFTPDGKINVAPQFLNVLCNYYVTGTPKTLGVKTLEGWQLYRPQGAAVNSTRYGNLFPRHDGGWLAETKGRGWVKLDAAGKPIAGPAPGYIDRLQGHYILTQVPTDATGEIGPDLVAYSRDGKWGLLHRDGRPAAEPEYDYVQPLFKGVAKALSSPDWGLIDSTGQPITSFRFRDINYAGPGLAAMLTTTGWQLFNTAGQQLNERSYERLNSFGGNLVEYLAGDENGLLKADGAPLFDQTFNEVLELNDGLILLRKGDKYGVGDTLGRILLPVEYNQVLPFNFGVAPVRKGELWGLIDEDGTLLLRPFLPELTPVGPERMRVKRNGSYYLYNFNGKQITEQPFDEILYFEDNTAMVQAHGQWGLLHRDGHLLLPLEYDYIEGFRLVSIPKTEE